MPPPGLLQLPLEEALRQQFEAEIDGLIGPIALGKQVGPGAQVAREQQRNRPLRNIICSTKLRVYLEQMYRAGYLVGQISVDSNHRVPS